MLRVDSPTRTIKEGSGGDGQILDVVLRDELAHEADVVRAAARHVGIDLSIEDGGHAVTIRL